MSAKRPAALTGGRQFKQTKLNFGSFAATSRQSKKPVEPKPSEDNSRSIGERTIKPDPKNLLSPQQDEFSEDQSPNSKTISSTPSPSPSSNPPISTPTPLPPPQKQPSSPSITKRIRILDKTGDLFTAPPSTLLIHACNAVGSWGGGIALAFRARYPSAFKIYQAHCARSTPDQLLGTALLIPPQPGDKDKGGQHYIGCLFTSRRYGKGRDKPEAILRATGPAVRGLMRLVVKEEEERGREAGEVRMCRINSGLFGVPWERSKEVIEGLELGEGEVPEGWGKEGVVEFVAYERE